MAAKNLRPAYVSVMDAAVHLSVSEVTIRRAVRSGQLPYVRIGRAIRIAVADLGEFATARRVIADGGDHE